MYNETPVLRRMVGLHRGLHAEARDVIPALTRLPMDLDDLVHDDHSLPQRTRSMVGGTYVSGEGRPERGTTDKTSLEEGWGGR